MEGQPSPPIASDDWLNTSPLDWEQLEGKVVLLDFWGVWCKPCVRAIPKLRELYEAHKKDGLVIIGVHTEEAAKRGKRFVAKKGIAYPIVFDDGDQIAKRFHASHYPCYYLIDREGVVRMADILDSEIESAIAFLLNEEGSGE